MYVYLYLELLKRYSRARCTVEIYILCTDSYTDVYRVHQIHVYRVEPRDMYACLYLYFI